MQNRNVYANIRLIYAKGKCINIQYIRTNVYVFAECDAIRHGMPKGNG